MEPRRPNVLEVSSEFHPDFRSYAIDGEDADQLEILANDYLAEFNPRTTIETFLVQTLVLSQWAQDRWTRIETALLRGAEDPVLVFMDPRAGRLMESLGRRQGAEQRRYYRALNELRRIMGPRQFLRRRTE